MDLFNKNYNVKRIMVFLSLLSALIFIVFVFSYHRYLHLKMKKEIKDYAEVISFSLWTFEKESSSAYLNLALLTNVYDSIDVYDNNDNEFLSLRGRPKSTLESVFSLTGLIPVYVLESKIVYEGNEIGKIVVKWPCKSVFLYISVLVFMLLILIGIGLFLKLTESKQNLETSVKKRTYELEKEISDKKAAEQLLRQQTERFALHIKHTPIGVIEWDCNLRVKQWNKAAEEIFEYTYEEAIDKSAFDLILPAKEKINAQMVWDKLVSDSGGTHSINIHHTKSKREKICQWYNTTLKSSDGSIIGVASLVLDITKQKKAEDEVWHYQNELEEMVHVRTKELTETVQSLKRRTFEADTMSRLGDLLQACEDDRESFTIVSSLCEQIFSCHSGFLALYEEDAEVLKVQAVFGDFPENQFEFEENDCWALKRGSSHTIYNAELDPVCRHIDKRKMAEKYSICVPIGAKGELMGLLHLVWATGEKPTESCEIEIKNITSLAKRVAELYALSLSNIRLKKRLHRQSIRDSLTGLFNRRYMEESLKREFVRAERKNTGVGVILFDVDHFKSFNDTYGHEAGDEVLRCLGNLLNDFTRGEDIATRYGGEELLLILTDCNIETLESRAEEIRENIEKLVINYEREKLKVTVSGGVACFPDHGRTPETVVVAADSALYQAKENGRNQVVSA